jgi:hypothetical protein
MISEIAKYNLGKISYRRNKESLNSLNHSTTNGGRVNPYSSRLADRQIALFHIAAGFD